MESDYNHYSLILRSDGHSLYLGDLESATDSTFLSTNRIRTVITAAAGMSHLKYDANIRHIRYDMLDGKKQKIAEYLEHAALQIDKYLRVGSVLVHCAAGISRSASLVIAYLIKCKGMKFSEALKLCKGRRHQVCPNLGFQMQLKALELRLSAKSGRIYHPLRQRSTRQLKDSLRMSQLSQMNHTHQPSFFPSFDYSLPRQIPQSQLNHHLPPTTSLTIDGTRLKQHRQETKKMSFVRFRLTHLQSRLKHKF